MYAIARSRNQYAFVIYNDINSHIPGAMTSNSQKFMEPIIGNCTMRYLKGGMLYGQYRDTVAAAGTAPGY